MRLVILKVVQVFFLEEGSAGFRRLEPGVYPVEEIPNPYDPQREPWIVRRGTRMGMLRAKWLEYRQQGRAVLVE